MAITDKRLGFTFSYGHTKTSILFFLFSFWGGDSIVPIYKECICVPIFFPKGISSGNPFIYFFKKFIRWRCFEFNITKIVKCTSC